jgi:hypothetical protein
VVGTGGRGGAGGMAGTGGSSCVPTTIQLLKNPNFDTTPTVWTEDSGFGSTIIDVPVTGLAPHTSPYVAWEGGYANAQDDLYQDVMIPAGATSITFSFYYYIATEEDPTYDYDDMTAYVYDPATQGFTPVMNFSNLDATAGWTLFSAPISLAWAGRVAEFGFLATTDSTANTNFFIDTTSVTVTACSGGVF